MSLLTVPSNKYEKQPTSCNCRDTEEEFWIKEKKKLCQSILLSVYMFWWLIVLVHQPTSPEIMHRPILTVSCKRYWSTIVSSTYCKASGPWSSTAAPNNESQKCVGRTCLASTVRNHSACSIKTLKVQALVCYRFTLLQLWLPAL